MYGQHRFADHPFARMGAPGFRGRGPGGRDGELLAAEHADGDGDGDGHGHGHGHGQGAPVHAGLERRGHASPWRTRSSRRTAYPSSCTCTGTRCAIACGGWPREPVATPRYPWRRLVLDVATTSRRRWASRGTP